MRDVEQGEVTISLEGGSLIEAIYDGKGKEAAPSRWGHELCPHSPPLILGKHCPKRPNFTATTF
jgi:hypothetical protein